MFIELQGELVNFNRVTRCFRDIDTITLDFNGGLYHHQYKSEEEALEEMKYIKEQIDHFNNRTTNHFRVDEI